MDRVGAETKFAVLTMDVEDWFHTGYLDRETCDRSVSILDVLEPFAALLEENGACGTFFVLGELIKPMHGPLNSLLSRGHEVASHGWNHIPPLQLSVAQFSAELRRCQNEHREWLSRPLEGFRSALFKMDRPRLEQVRAAGFMYDSSSTARGRRSSQIDLTGFKPLRKMIWQDGDFIEFQVGGAGVSSYFINGGGGTRLLPWGPTLHLLRNFVKRESYYNFFTHPLDVSAAGLPLPPSLSWLTRARLLGGRSQMMAKLAAILQELRAENYRFVTFTQLRRELLGDAPLIKR